MSRDSFDFFSEGGGASFHGDSPTRRNDTRSFHESTAAAAECAPAVLPPLVIAPAAADNDSVVVIVQSPVTPQSPRPVLHSAGYYSFYFVINTLVTFALVGEWFHDLFEVLSNYDRAPSEEIQKTWFAFVVLGIAATSSALAEISNYYYARKNPNLILGADEALFLLCSGPLFFFAFQLLSGANAIPLEVFVPVSAVCFGIFVKKCISSSVEKKDHFISFEAFDQLERKTYLDATTKERFINAAKTGGAAALSVSAVIATVSREVNGQTERLTPWQFEFVFLLVMAAGKIGFDLTRVPKLADIAAAIFSGFEEAALAYRGMSGLFYMLVVYSCSDSTFCANDWQRELLICISLLVALGVGLSGMVQARLDFEKRHDNNLWLLAAPERTVHWGSALLRRVKECCAGDDATAAVDESRPLCAN